MSQKMNQTVLLSVYLLFTVTEEIITIVYGVKVFVGYYDGLT